MTADRDPSVPSISYARLFLRFLRFGSLAWGGPVAQIAMIRQELVDEERWVSRERFNRVLAVYQMLPGPEAHELCVYFGMLARGRIGGTLAGLGFMLPGFVLMFALSWVYVTYGIRSPAFAAIFAGCQAAVVALVVRAVHRIGQHALLDPWLWGVALGSGVASLLGVNLLLVLLVAALAYAGKSAIRHAGTHAWLWIPGSALAALTVAGHPTLPGLFASGLRTGLLTFGGAYTAIPFLQHDAVEVGKWMTNAQFLDGLALSGTLPAPLIIFSTFVGYLGGGASGAVALTLGVFVPAFAFTLVGHDLVERLVENRKAHAFLDGLAAGVVGLIAATAIGLLRAAVTSLPAFLIFAGALVVAYRWRARTAVVWIMFGAGFIGWLAFRV